MTGDITTGTRAWWSFSGGGSLLDNHGQIPLTNNNGVTFTPGLVDFAADFERDNTQFLSCASNATVQMGDFNWAISAWVKPESLPASGSQYMIVAKDSNAAASRDYFLDLHNQAGSCHFRIFIANSAGSFAFAEQIPTTINVGQWYHLLAQHNAGADTVSIYVDGVLAGSNTTAGLVPNASAAEFRIGARAYATFEDYFDGQIEDVRLYKDRLFTAGDIAALRAYRGARSVAFSPAYSPAFSPAYSPMDWRP
jgi:hypothetical protein